MNQYNRVTKYKTYEKKNRIYPKKESSKERGVKNLHYTEKLVIL